MASGISTLFATAVPTNAAVPISDGSGSANESLNDWVTSGSGGIDLQTALDALSATHGAIIFRGASAWQALEPGVAGGFLTTNGVGSNPTWSLGTGLFDQWVANVDAAGGTYEVDSKSICSDLSDQLLAGTFFPKLVYLLPLLGADLIAASIPLIDTLGVGAPTNHNFVGGDFDQTTGLQGNGSSKYWDLMIKPSQLGATSNGGMGYWENNIDFSGSGTQPIGNNSTSQNQRYALDLRSSQQTCRWGDLANFAGPLTSASDGHYYFQRSGSTSREIFKDGSSIGTNTTSDSAAGISDRNAFLMANNESVSIAYWSGRCAVAYMTDGTLTPTEIGNLHTLLDTYLITPTGR